MSNRVLVLLALVSTAACSAIPLIPDNSRYENVRYLPPPAPDPARVDSAGRMFGPDGQPIDRTQVHIDKPSRPEHPTSETLPDGSIVKYDENGGAMIAHRKDDLSEMIDDACETYEAIQEYKGAIKHEWSEAHKYGVVNVDNISTNRSLIEGSEERYESLAGQIKEMRHGKALNPKKECPK